MLDSMTVISSPEQTVQPGLFDQTTLMTKASKTNKKKRGRSEIQAVKYREGTPRLKNKPHQVTSA